VTDVVRTLNGNIRISGKVESASVTFAEVDAEYESESGAASREVTREDLECAGSARRVARPVRKSSHLKSARL
jgi:hypothetical protein